MTYIDPPSKLLYHTDRIAAIDAGLAPAPVNAEIDLSNRCNLGCKGCHMSFTHSRGPHASMSMPEGFAHTGDLMNTRLAFSIVDQLVDSGVRSITWTGGGEPLLHPDALEIFSYRNIDQGLYTNGTLIDPLKAAVLKHAMEWVYVSLDRHTRDGYIQYKQSDQFDRAIMGIRSLVRATGKATIGVGFLLDRDNYMDGKAMIDLALDTLGADYVQFRPMVEFNPSDPGKVAQDTAWMLPVADWLRVQVAQYPGKVIADPLRFEMYRTWNGHGYPLCYWAQMQTVITPSGRVWVCVNRRGMQGSCLGDLNSESFDAIWHRASAARPVDAHCRVLCRGHIPNLQLSQMLGAKPPHWRFI